MGAILSKSRDQTECHGYNCKWDNGIFTPSSNSEGEVASIPLKQREEKRQAFSKEGGAGKQGGTDNLQLRGKVRQCCVKGCGFETIKAEPEIARLMLGLHYKLAREQLLARNQQIAHDQEDQEEQIVLKCTECQYTTPECQSLGTANWILQSHKNRANHAAPVRQVEDSEDDVI